MSDRYIYLFIRQDLSHQQQIIQTAHAVNSLDYPGMGVEEEVPNMVLIGVNNEQGLHDIAYLLQRNYILFSMFSEPDINGQSTAIATHPLEDAERKLFRKFKTM